MAISTVYAARVTTTETVTTGTPAATNANSAVKHDQYDTDVTLIAGSSPPGTICAYFLQALTAGTATIDLTALTGTNDGAIDGTGLKVQVLKMKNLGANVMSITFGAANPYNLVGSDFKITLAQDQEVTIYGNDATPDIAAGAKNMDLAGTTTQTAEISIVMG